MVKPRPRKHHLARRRIARQGKLVARVAHDGAVADVRVHNLESLALVKRHRGLAAAAAVWRVARNGKRVRAAGGPGGDGLALFGANVAEVAFAGKVAAVGFEGGADVVVYVPADVGVVARAEGRRGFHFHVARCDGDEARHGGEDVKELHFSFGFRI